MLTPFLEDLESRIDAEEEESLFAEWQAFATGNFSGGLFSPRRTTRRPPTVEWPQVSANMALDSFDAMVLHQLGLCSDLLAKGLGSLLAVRANYGTPILPSLFGVTMYRMDDALNTLPTCYPLVDRDAISAVIDRGVPSLWQSLAGQALETTRNYVKLFADYPNIARYVHIYHPDTQGPMDLCELVWGNDIFIACYEEPALVHSLLAMMTETYTVYMRVWESIVPFRREGVAVHWGMLHRGNIMLRTDTAMNFSAAMYAEFIKPYDQCLLDEFGGGAIHFCGRGDHYIDQAASMHGVFAINLTQPEYNDMEAIYQHTVDQNIQLMDLSRQHAESAIALGRDLHDNVHVKD
ncbi:MAG: hypothetical protein ACYDBB_09685 [Armatimonadota bacterium]